MMGYDDTISIEHEDGLMSFELAKAVHFLKEVLAFQDRGEMFLV
jgi:hypothetical protein